MRRRYPARREREAPPRGGRHPEKPDMSETLCSTDVKSCAGLSGRLWVLGLPEAGEQSTPWDRWILGEMRRLRDEAWRRLCVIHNEDLLVAREPLQVLVEPRLEIRTAARSETNGGI